jgi:hypothetical protein
MLSKDDELDLLSEDEGENIMQEFKNGETLRLGEDNLMSPES